jgi:hypothetical protein
MFADGSPLGLIVRHNCLYRQSPYFANMDKPNFAKQYFVDKAIDEAAFILERIDKK